MEEHDLRRARQEQPSPGVPERFDGVWHEAEHSSRVGASLVFDSRRKRLIQFGGLGPNSYGRASLWVFDPSSDCRWMPLIAVGEAPSARASAAAVYDSLEDRVVIFGGDSRAGPRSGHVTVGDLWELRLGGLPRWRRLEVAGVAPSPRELCGVALDERRRRMVLVGGARFVGSPIDYDPYSYVSDVWAFRLGGTPRWEQVSTSGESPPPAIAFGAAYDSDRDQLVVMGGLRPGGLFGPRAFYGDVWTLRLGESPEWNLLGPEQLREGPSPRDYPSPSLVYDRARHRIVVFSGRDSVTKAFEPGSIEAWVKLGASGHGPSTRFGQSMVMDPESREILLTGGDNGEPVWRLSLNEDAAWQLDDRTGTVPGVSVGSTLTADSERGRAIFCGGTTTITIDGIRRPIPSDEVWTFSFDAERWSRWEGVRIPRGGLTGHRAVLDPTRDRLLLLGGSAPGESPNTPIPNPYLYSLSLAGPPAWSEVYLGELPSRLTATPSVVFDPVRDRLLLQGGEPFDTTPSTVWTLPLLGEARIETLTVAGVRPVNAFGRSVVFDPVRDRLVVELDRIQFREPGLSSLWEIRLDEPPTWSMITVGGPSPRPRIRQFSAYDPAADRIVTLGGSWIPDGRVYAPAPGAWALSLSGGAVWDSLELHGPPPLPRGETAAALDPRTRKLVATRGGQGELDTYILDFHRPTRSVDALAIHGRGSARGRLRSRGERDVAILSEPAFDARRLAPASLRLDGLAVQRMHNRWSTWESDINRDGLADLVCRFSRRDAAGSDRHDLRVLTGTDPEGYPLRGEVRVGTGSHRDEIKEYEGERGVESAFGLLGTTPSPSIGGRLHVRFVLPSRERATLDLVDVTGRRIARRDVSGAPGPRNLDFEGGPAMTPGLYWLQLRQGSRIATTRVVSIR